MRLIIPFLLLCSVSFPLLGQQGTNPVFLSLRAGYTQSTPEASELVTNADWAFSYGADVTIELISKGRFRPTAGLGLEVTNVKTLVEHPFIVNESTVDEFIRPDDVNVSTRLTNLSVPLQLNYFLGNPGGKSAFFVFLRSDLLIGLGASSGEVTDPDDGLPIFGDRRLRQGQPVAQADIAHFLGLGFGIEQPLGNNGRVLRLQPMVRFSTLDLLDTPDVSGEQLNYLRATDVMELGLTASIGF